MAHTDVISSIPLGETETTISPALTEVQMTEWVYNNQTEADVQEYGLEADGPDLQLSDHFRLIEFASRDGADLVLVHPALVEGLEELRKRLKCPVHINSGYRTPKHNARIGGVPNSMHTKGMAADIHCRNQVPLWKVHREAKRLGFGGIGKYRTFVHVDVFGENRRWKQ